MTEAELTFLKQFVLEDRLQRFEQVLDHRTRYLTVVLENLHHEHNASACLRTADCLGLQDVHIVERSNRFQPNTEIALGASKWLTLHRYSDAADPESSEPTVRCLQALKGDGYQIVATSPVQNSVPLPQVDLSRKTAVVFGSEQAGVSAAGFELADQRVHIPMWGFTESFNISVSLALILNSLGERLRQTDFPWQLSTDERHQILSAWVQRTLGEKYEPLHRRFLADHSQNTPDSTDST